METPPPFIPQAAPEVVAAQEEHVVDASVAQDASPSPDAEHSADAPSATPPTPDGSAAETMPGLDADTMQRIADMIADAEVRGYLRGRNEKIEATQHFDPDPELDPEPAHFPAYARRSVWDTTG